MISYIVLLGFLEVESFIMKLLRYVCKNLYIQESRYTLLNSLRFKKQQEQVTRDRSWYIRELIMEAVT